MFFDSLVRARDVLLDDTLRKIYDNSCEEGLQEHALAQERAEVNETTFDDDSDHDVEWRKVEEGEVFGPGEYFWMDQSTGLTYVAVHVLSSCNEANEENNGYEKYV